MKIIQAFENAGTLGAVSRPIEGLAGDVQLAIDIRRFQLAAGAEPAGEVELAAKVLDGKGLIADPHLFHATAPAASAHAPAAAAALDRAFGAAAVELVVWTSRTIADRWLSASAPEGTVRGRTTRGEGSSWLLPARSASVGVRSPAHPRALRWPSLTAARVSGSHLRSGPMGRAGRARLPRAP
jgi:hypothetical protein